MRANGAASGIINGPPRWPGRVGTLGALAGLALLAAACAGTTTASTPGRAPTTMSTSVARGTPSACQASDLRAAFASHSAATSNVTARIDLVNTSNARCSLYGYPGFSLIGRARAPLALNLIRGGGFMPVGNAQPARIVLSAGQTAHFTLQWNRGQGDCETSTAIVVTPPGDTAGLKISSMISSGVSLDPCGTPPPPAVHVSPIAAGG